MRQEDLLDEVQDNMFNLPPFMPIGSDPEE